MDRSTIFSPCRQYRYTLWREFSGLLDDGSYAAFVCLNPSTADEVQDDPTVRRCIEYTKGWGLSAFCMLNIFAFRATDPAVMKAHPEPIGVDNDHHLQRVAAGASIVVAGWGVHGAHLGRAESVRTLLPDLHFLKLTKDGHPGHPLYLRASLKPQRWLRVAG